MSPEERFWAKVNKTEGCWLWLAGKTSSGYGMFWNGEFREYAHRFSYKLLHGPIPDGLEIDHSCNNRACVRQKHLEAVTHSENQKRTKERNVIKKQAKISKNSVAQKETIYKSVEQVRAEDKARLDLLRKINRTTR